jgi:hypothetical protein
VKRVVPSVIGVLLVGGVVVDLALNGFAWGHACDAGFESPQDDQSVPDANSSGEHHRTHRALP